MKNKVKSTIVLLVPSLNKCGPNNIVFCLCQSIALENSDFYIISLEEKQVKYDLRFDDFADRIIFLNSKGFYSLFFLLSKINEILKNLVSVIIHSHGLRPDIIAALLVKHTRVSTIHSQIKEDYILKYGFLRGFLASYFQFKLLNRFDIVFACSDAVRRHLVSQGVKKVCTIRNGIDTEKYHFADLRSESHRKRIISVGHLTYRKNPLFLIEKYLEQTLFDDFDLVFMGTGELDNACRKASNNNQNIYFLGYSDSVNLELHKSTIFVSCSKSEGFPNAVLEALCCGLPVLLSDIPSHREILSIVPEFVRIFTLESNDFLYKFDEIKTISPSLKISDHCKKVFSSTIMGNSYLSEYKKLD